MADYGITYQGCKASIIHKLASVMPSAENFYDLFGGGFSVTHYMMMQHKTKYKNFYFNEIEKRTCDLIEDAIKGKYNYNVFKQAWIDRETFLKNKDICAYTSLVWSFGNDQKSYLCRKALEAQKKSIHNAIVFNEFDERAISILGRSKLPNNLSIRGRRLFCRKILIKLGIPQQQQLERQEQIERLERIQRLEGLKIPEISSQSYDQIKIKPNSVIYCDPPYKNMKGYLRDFNHDKFWCWVRKQSEPVFVSEYTAPDDIKTIMAVRDNKSLAATSWTKSVEKLFCNNAALRGGRTSIN